MNIIKKFIKDYQTASENKEFYDQCQRFYKGQHAESNALMEHMSLHYLPKSLKTLMFWKMNLMNSFFNNWLSFKKFSVLTLVMIVAIIWLIK